MYYVGTCTTMYSTYTLQKGRISPCHHWYNYIYKKMCAYIFSLCMDFETYTAYVCTHITFPLFERAVFFLLELENSISFKTLFTLQIMSFVSKYLHSIPIARIFFARYFRLLVLAVSFLWKSRCFFICKIKWQMYLMTFREQLHKKAYKIDRKIVENSISNRLLVEYLYLYICYLYRFSYNL